ncbi:MAG TPA: 1,4-alpha-glucan branching protein domain-containing protein, partial [Solirubrobacteraceae bacterium]|nr:1,4-alpha-glucan branching protein domain-containing protein [Solirubrobacteraceae bacterium]
VLCDQLEAPGIGTRFTSFVEQVRSHTHAEDAAGMRAGGHDGLARELERSWQDYEGALQAFERRRGDMLDAFSPHAQWTSSATHAVLPLLASDAGVRLQVQGGIEAHRERFGDGWRGGFWLPECAYVSRLEPLLKDLGVAATCVELTGIVPQGAREHLQPLLGDAGVLLVPVDRASIALAWSDRGYPADGVYRDYHHHTVHHHNPWSNDGSDYDHARALARARGHAADFVERTIARLRRDGVGLPGGGLAVFAVDTELFGHWWYEGIAWLTAVVEECARQGLELLRLDDALERIEPAPWATLAGARPGDAVAQQGAERAITWGQDYDLSTWSGTAVAELTFAARAGELEVLGAGDRVGAAAVRELLALQASDWPFMVSREIAAVYARERFDGHRAALSRALAEGREADSAPLRNLAARVRTGSLLGV